MDLVIKEVSRLAPHVRLGVADLIGCGSSVREIAETLFAAHFDDWRPDIKASLELKYMSWVVEESYRVGMKEVQ